jgi:hypothetical protein
VSLLITEQTYERLKNQCSYAIRFIDTVKVKGKSESVKIYEVFDTDSPDIKQAKLATKKIFEQGLVLYHNRKITEAATLFAQCLETCARDGYLKFICIVVKKVLSRFQVSIL